MKLQPTDQQVELYRKLDQTTDKEEQEKIVKALKEIAIQRDKELKDCPFAH